MHGALEECRRRYRCQCISSTSKEWNCLTSCDRFAMHTNFVRHVTHFLLRETHKAINQIRNVWNGACILQRRRPHTADNWLIYWFLLHLHSYLDHFCTAYVSIELRAQRTFCRKCMANKFSMVPNAVRGRVQLREMHACRRRFDADTVSKWISNWLIFFSLSFFFEAHVSNRWTDVNSVSVEKIWMNKITIFLQEF